MTTYTVQAGDTLSSIAQDFYGSSSSYSAIMAANPSITNANVIYEGQILQIPDSGTPAVSAPVTMAPPTSQAASTPAPTAPTSLLGAAPEMTKMMWILVALSAAVLGFYLMKHFAEKKGLEPLAAEPEEAHNA